MELSEKELRKSNADLHKEIKALNIRVKDALSATKTITKTIVDERVRVDTVNNVILAEHKDAWNIIRSEQVGDSARLYYEGRDSIVGVISVRKKRFLFFRWGVKAVEYDLSNKNPKTRINIDIARYIINVYVILFTTRKSVTRNSFIYKMLDLCEISFVTDN